MRSPTRQLINLGLEFLIPGGRKSLFHISRSIVKEAFLVAIEEALSKKPMPAMAEKYGSRDASPLPSLSQTRMEELLRFTKSFGDRSDLLLDELIGRFPSDVRIKEDVLFGVCCAIMASPSDPLNVLLLGEPATGKTRILDFIESISADTVRAGLRVTPAKLTVDMRKNFPGLLHRANGKILLIDEFDKLGDDAIDQLYEAMESGRVTMNIDPGHSFFESRFSLLAAANPIGDLFAADQGTSREQTRLTIPAALLSRFHMIYVLRGLEGEQLRSIVLSSLTSTSLQNNNGFLRDFIRFVREKGPSPSWNVPSNSQTVEDATSWIHNAITLSGRNDAGIYLTPRLAVAVRRIAEALARMRFANRVVETDLQTSMRIAKGCYGSLLEQEV